jgi:hypothetical protein
LAAPELVSGVLSSGARGRILHSCLMSDILQQAEHLPINVIDAGHVTMLTQL